MRRASEYPAFRAGPAESGADFCSTQLRAEQLAEMIAEVWREAGFAITPKLESASKRGDPVWRVLLPELVNGLAPEHLRITTDRRDFDARHLRT